MKRIYVQRLCLLVLVSLLFGCSSMKSGTKKATVSSAVVNPEDVLSENQSFNTFNDGNVTITARKGTIAASVKNAMRLSDASCTSKEREDILNWFREYATTLVVLFQGQIAFANPELQQILTEARVKIDAKNSTKS